MLKAVVGAAVVDHFGVHRRDRAGRLAAATRLEATAVAAGLCMFPTEAPPTIPLPAACLGR